MAAPRAPRALLALLLLLLVGGALAGGYVWGLAQGEADDRDELLGRVAKAEAGVRPAAPLSPEEASRLDRNDLLARLALEQAEIANLTGLSRTQEALLKQLTELRELEEKSATQRVTLADSLRESVEMSSALLLLEVREELAPLGSLDRVERAARAALEPYEGRENESLAASSREVKNAALALLGDVLLAKGQLPEASEARRATLALARVRLAAQPTLPARRSALARAHEALAESLESGADAAGALTERREALEHWKALSDAEPKELAWLGALADAIARTSSTLATLGREPEARAHAEQAVALARGLRTAEPQESRWARVLARALAALALRQPVDGATLPAEATYVEALKLLETPGAEVDAGQLAERADLLHALGKALVQAKRTNESVDRLREALDVAVDVVSRAPLARAGQERLARVCSDLAEALEVQGDPEDALRGREEAVSAWRRVSDLDPQRTEPRHELLHALLAWGDLLARSERLDEALAAYREGGRLAAAFEGPVGAHASAGSDLAECHDRAAATLLALGRRAEALAAWREALGIIEPLAKKTPENAFWQADLARIWWHLGQALLASEPDRAEGRRALKRALRLLAPLETSRRLPDYAATWPASLRELLGGAGEAEDAEEKGR